MRALALSEPSINSSIWVEGLGVHGLKPNTEAASG